MPDFVLNCAGVTRTTGTADPVIIGGTGKSRSMSDLADGTEIAYYRRYKSSKAGFENAIGIWRVNVTPTSIGYIERTSIEASSNDDAPVVWGVGEQWIDVTANLSMLESLGINELEEASSVDGTERAHFLKDGEGVSLSAQDIAGDAITALTGLNRDYRSRYTDFSLLPSTFIATDNVICGLEPWIARVSNSATVFNFAQLGTGVSVLSCNTQTNSAGRASVQHIDGPFFYSLLYSIDQSADLILSAIPASGNGATIQFGWVRNLPDVADRGIYFELTEASPNWFAVKNDQSTITRKDTGIAAVIGTNVAFRAHFEPGATSPTRYYIDGVLVSTITGVEQTLNDNTLLTMALIVKKTSGTTAIGVGMSQHFYKRASVPITGFP